MVAAGATRSNATPALVAHEVGQGLVSRSGARNYGVVIAEDGTIDAMATEALRDTLRSERGAELPLFNYGPKVEDLRAACLAETGLPAPLQPRWLLPLALAAE